MKRIVDFVYVVSALACLLPIAGCSAEAPAEQSSVSSANEAQNGVPELRANDDCDPSDFAGLCNPAFHGNTTLPEFTAELDAKQSVGAWKYSSPVGVQGNRGVNVVSRGGETHTFTVVQNYGGGKVPALNQASGNPVAAPECLQAVSATNLNVTSGSTQKVTTGPGGTLPPGHYKVQCCIHPWMRTEIDVR